MAKHNDIVTQGDGTAVVSGRLYIEYMPLSELTSAKRNPKRHRLDTVEDSFRRFGFVEVPVIDERTGRLVAGHGRIEALRRRKAAGHAAPEGIEDKGDDWLIPVERGKRFASDAEAAAYLVASNRTSEIGGWDFPELNELAREIEATATEGLLGTGFTMDEIAQALEREVQGMLDGAPPGLNGAGGDGDGAPDQSAKADVGFAVIIQCRNEGEQLKIIEECQVRGWSCRALT